MTAENVQRGLRAWVGRVMLSLGAALLAGVLAYLLARAITTVYLFYQQQQFVQETAAVLRGGGIEALANSNIRELRQQVAALEASYASLSMQVGFAAAALGAVLSYVWQEWAQMKA